MGADHDVSLSVYTIMVKEGVTNNVIEADTTTVSAPMLVIALRIKMSMKLSGQILSQYLMTLCRLCSAVSHTVALCPRTNVVIVVFNMMIVEVTDSWNSHWVPFPVVTQRRKSSTFWSMGAHLFSPQTQLIPREERYTWILFAPEPTAVDSLLDLPLRCLC